MREKQKLYTRSRSKWWLLLILRTRDLIHVIITFLISRIAYCIIDFKDRSTNYLTWRKFSIRSARLASLKCAYVFNWELFIRSFEQSRFSFKHFPLPSFFTHDIFNCLEFYGKLFSTFFHIVRLKKKFATFLWEDNEKVSRDMTALWNNLF